MSEISGSFIHLHTKKIFIRKNYKKSYETLNYLINNIQASIESRSGESRILRCSDCCEYTLLVRKVQNADILFT